MMKFFSQQVQLIILLILASATLSNAQNMEGALLFGKSKINITPGISVDLHGYGQQRISSGVDDSLYCRVAYFQLNDKELVLVSTDVCVIPDEVYNAVKDSLIAKFGFAQDEIFIAATHTHSGPEITFRENYPYQNNLLYTVDLLNKIQTTFIDLQLPAKNYFTYTVNPNLPKRNLNITIASLGELCLIGMGAEVCVEIGMILQNLSPFKNTVIITHCNGASGYLPSANMYPERGYEVSGSLFAPGAADQAIVKTIEALDSLHQVSTTSGSEIYQTSASVFQANIYSSENTPGRYTFEFKNIKHGKVHCQLHTLDGKTVFNEVFSQCGKTFTTHIDLGNLRGMYLLTSVSGKNIHTRKIIVN